MSVLLGIVFIQQIVKDCTSSFTVKGSFGKFFSPSVAISSTRLM